MVGDGEGGLLELLGAGDEVIDPVGAVEETVLGMRVEMNEAHILGNLAARHTVGDGRGVYGRRW